MTHTSRTGMEKIFKNQTENYASNYFEKNQQLASSNSHTLIIQGFFLGKPDFKFFFKHKTKTRPEQKDHQPDVPH